MLDAVVGTLKVDVFASGLSYPWSAVVLPEGDLLVSEKYPGGLRRVGSDGTISEPLAGLPPIYAAGNGGMLGLALDPAFPDNRLLYFAFSEPGGDDLAGLSVARAALGPGGLSGLEVVFRQTPKVDDIRNSGGRLVFATDGTLFVTTGDRFAQDLVQPLDNTIGVVARIAPDGSIPADNPFVDQDGVDPAIWSSGHRNVAGAALHPVTGQLWIHELGPWGGDELNIVEPGRNYGWPLVSWGHHYTGELIPKPSSRPELAPSIYHWNPVISPSGMVFYTGSAIPDWSGNLLIGGLSSQALVRLTLRDDRVIAEERFDLGTRIRDVLVGPEGGVLLLTDEEDGKVLRLTLAED